MAAQLDDRFQSDRDYVTLLLSGAPIYQLPSSIENHFSRAPKFSIQSRRRHSRGLVVPPSIYLEKFLAVVDRRLLKGHKSLERIVRYFINRSSRVEP